MMISEKIIRDEGFSQSRARLERAIYDIKMNGEERDIIRDAISDMQREFNAANEAAGEAGV